MAIRTIQNILILLSLVLSSYSYLQLKLVRVPHQTKAFNPGKVSCMTDIPQQKSKKKSQDEDDSDEQTVQDDDNFKEICYEKDISYAIQLYKNDQLYLLSMDLTTPISWIKGQKCHLGQTKKSCSRVQVNFKQKIQNLQKKVKKMFDFTKKKSKKHNQLALIEGSSEVVKGNMEKTQNLVFQTRDSGRLTRLKDLLLLGLAVYGQKDKMTLKSTNFINATEISPNLNYICDGAISLRFDENSESSFLKEMAQAAQSKDKFVTISLARNKTVTIGDISIKNSKQGYSGIKWVKLEQDENYGKLGKLENIYLTQEGLESKKTVQSDYPVVFTISSSSIQLPEKPLESMIKKFFKGKNCSINAQTRYLECSKMKSSDLDKQINFVFSDSDIMLKLSDLVLKHGFHNIVFNIKKALDENFIILGEPIFTKHFVVLDYNNDRIGISNQRTSFVEQILNVVTLIRFVVWIIVIFIILICCSSPIQRMFSGSSKKPKGRRRKKYSPIQQNPYDEIKGTIQDEIQVPKYHEVQGI